MEKTKEFLKTKKGKITTAVISILLVVSCIGGGYIYSENQKKMKALDSMKITFKEELNLNEIEYGSTNEVKDLISEVAGGEIKEYPKVDTTKIGEQTLKFTVSKGKYSKEIEQKIKIVDTKAPEITFEADTRELVVGDEYDIKSNITSVKDPIDGDIELVEDAKDINEKATKEYKELAKVDIKDDTKIADKLMSDFVIVDGETEDSDKTLFLKNAYYIDGSVDTATAGDYTIKIVAVDKNGIKSEKEYTVNVKEKVVEPTPQASGGSTNGGSYSNGGGSSSDLASGSGSSTPVSPMGKSYLVNYALGMVGQTGWNCADFITHVLTQSGYLPQGTTSYLNGNYYNISVTDLQPGDIVRVPGHVYMITSYPTINEQGTYTWTRVDAGAGGNQTVVTTTATYNPKNGASSTTSYLRF